ncbi:MAG: hypothetical protein QXF78_01805 [Pyrobaculum sp.]
MQSLELAVLVGFSLLIIFAAVPYIWQSVAASMAQLEARQYMSFFVTFADSLSADFGMSGVRRSYVLPNLLYGSLSVRSYPMEIRCGGRSVRVYQLYVWYNSSYILGGARPLRGERNVTVAHLGQPIAAVNASSLGFLDAAARGYVLFTGPVLVKGEKESVLYVINVSRVEFRGGSLGYKVTAVKTPEVDHSLMLTSPDGYCTVSISGKSWRVRLGERVRLVVTEVVVS